MKGKYCYQFHQQQAIHYYHSHHQPPSLQTTKTDYKFNSPRSSVRSSRSRKTETKSANFKCRQPIQYYSFQTQLIIELLFVRHRLIVIIASSLSVNRNNLFPSLTLSVRQSRVSCHLIRGISVTHVKHLNCRFDFCFQHAGLLFLSRFPGENSIFSIYRQMTLADIQREESTGVTEASVNPFRSKTD